MAHARRLFAELVKIAKTTGKSHQAISYFQKFYALGSWREIINILMKSAINCTLKKLCQF